MLRPIALICLAFLATVGARAACDYPVAPTDLPTGKTETEEQMLAAQKVVKDYQEKVQDYLTCIDDKLAALGERATSEHQLIHDKRYNSALDYLDATASKYNEAVRNFKARGE